MNSHKLQLAILIGRRIRRQRIKLGLSLTNVAEAVGLGVGYLSYIETGQRNASLQVVVHLCRVLSLRVEEVINTSPETLGWKGPGMRSAEGDIQELSLQLLTDPKESRLAIISATLPLGQPCHLAGLQGGVLTAIQGIGCSILRSEESEAVLTQGDALTFRRRKPLTWFSTKAGPSTVLWVGRPGGEMRNNFRCA